VVSCHAKDVRLTRQFPSGLEECPPGQGGVDYATYLRELAKLPHEPPLMLEHLPGPAEYDAARGHLLALADRLGLSF
jgi:sugar phosphate isomerase/epimerase